MLDAHLLRFAQRDQFAGGQRVVGQYAGHREHPCAAESSQQGGIVTTGRSCFK